MKKRVVLALALSIIMTASTVMTGCSSSKNTASESDGAKVSDESASTSDTTGGDSQTTDSASSEPDTLDIYINMPWYPVKSFTGIIPDAIKAATNVDLNVTIATDTAQLGVMIASGEIPDIVYTDFEADRLSNSNLCYSFSELESKYGASFADVSDEEKNICKSLSSDGDYYTVLNYYNTAEEWANLKIGAPGQPCIYYRKDLIEAMGNPKLETMDDLSAVLEQCKTAYPDMTPFGLGGYWKFQTLYSWAGVPMSMYDKTNFYYDATVPKYKDFLQLANMYVRNGYATAEAYANASEADSHQMAYNSQCVFYNWYLSYSNLNQLQNETQKITPTAEWAILPRLGEPSVGTARGWAGTFVSKTCKNVEAAARLLSYLYSEEGSRTSMWGREGTDYTLDENGVPQFSDEYKTARSDGTMNEKYNTFFYNGSSAITEIYMNYSGIDQSILDQVSSYGEGYVNYPEVGIATPNASTDEGIIRTKLDEVKISYEAKVIFAASDDEFNSYYNEYMDALNQCEVQKYNDYMTQKTKEVKTEFGFK